MRNDQRSIEAQAPRAATGERRARQRPGVVASGTGIPSVNGENDGPEVYDE